MTNRNWRPIIERAKTIVLGYPYLITLRQLHYRLVAEAVGGYVNTEQDYKVLSRLTAEGRRDGSFPALLDQTRRIQQMSSWSSPRAAVDWLAQVFHTDRTEGQPWQVVIGGEKATLLAQLQQWFGELGVPIVLLRGFGSQTYMDDVRRHVERDGRPAVLIYAGDLDASGVDILRDFTERCPVFAKVEHVATLEHQVTSLGLIVNRGKGDDSRAQSFRTQYPKLARYADRQVSSGAWPAQRHNVVQVETEAIPPDDLRSLYAAAIGTYWDTSTYEAAVEREQFDRGRLQRLAKRWVGGA